MRIEEFAVGTIRVSGRPQPDNKTTTKGKNMLAEITGNFIPFAAGLAGLGGAIGVGLAGAKGAEAVGRNPGAFGKIFTTTLIAMALAEGIAILGFFVLPGLLKG